MLFAIQWQKWQLYALFGVHIRDVKNCEPRKKVGYNRMYLRVKALNVREINEKGIERKHWCDHDDAVRIKKW